VAIGFYLRGLYRDGRCGHFGHRHGGMAVGMATRQWEGRPLEDWQREQGWPSRGGGARSAGARPLVGTARW
jgi:hypothetical protein